MRAVWGSGSWRESKLENRRLLFVVRMGARPTYKEGGTQMNNIMRWIDDAINFSVWPTLIGAAVFVGIVLICEAWRHGKGQS